MSEISFFYYFDLKQYFCYVCSVIITQLPVTFNNLNKNRYRMATEPYEYIFIFCRMRHTYFLLLCYIPLLTELKKNDFEETKT